LRAQLAVTSVGYLVEDGPILSTHPIPTTTLSALHALPAEALAGFVPQTENEAKLHSAMLKWTKKAHEQAMGRESERTVTVLLITYAEKARAQLAKREEKGKKTREKLMGDGRPRMLTDDDFFATVQEHAADMRQQAADKANRERGTERWKAAMAAWEHKDNVRKELNEGHSRVWKLEVLRWEAERDLAKAEKRRPTWTKPGNRGPLPGPDPKPKKKDYAINEPEEDVEMGEPEREDEGEQGDVDGEDRD
jgi:hypothetical protein